MSLHDVVAEFRRGQAARLHWPAGVLTVCERLEAEHPPWAVTWEWTAAEGAGPPGRYRARSPQYVGERRVRDAYGTTEPELLDDMAAAVRQAEAEDAKWARWQERRARAEREGWPSGALEVCERLQAEHHPRWDFDWGPLRFRARYRRDAGLLEVRDAYGTTEEILRADMEAALVLAGAGSSVLGGDDD